MMPRPVTALLCVLIAPVTCWRGSARHTRHRDLKDLLLQRGCRQLAQFHERCAPRAVSRGVALSFEGNEHLRSTSASGQLHALDALAVGVGGDEPR